VRPGHILLRQNEEPEGRRSFCLFPDGRFYVTKNGKATLTTFGLVRLLKDNIPGKEQYWVTLDPG
jgi:hypothetical protein